MSVNVEFEDGLIQNRAVFNYLEEMKSKVPDIVQDTGTKRALQDLKKDIQMNITQIDQAEKKQIDELIDVFHEKNAEVWTARSELKKLVDKINEVNSDYDARRKQASKAAIEACVNQINLDYQIVNTRYQLNAARFMSVDALTSKGDLKKTLVDKITAAAMQAQANLEQERLLEAARLAELEKEQVLKQKEQELRQREADVARRETSDVQAMQAQIEQERANAKAKAKSLENVRTTYEEKQSGVIERLTALEYNIKDGLEKNPNKTYTASSVLNMVKKIKEMLQ